MIPRAPVSRPQGKGVRLRVEALSSCRSMGPEPLGFTPISLLAAARRISPEETRTRSITDQLASRGVSGINPSLLITEEGTNAENAAADAATTESPSDTAVAGAS